MPGLLFRTLPNNELLLDNEPLFEFVILAISELVLKLKLLTKINQTENTESRFNARLQELQQNYNLEKYNVFDINFIGKAVGLTERAKSENTQRYVFLIYNSTTLLKLVHFVKVVRYFKLKIP